MITPAPACVELYLQGARALAWIEHNGVRIDEARLGKTIEWAGAEIESSVAKVKADPLWAEWRKKFGASAKLNSGPQLAWLVYDHLGYAPRSFTDTGAPSTEESAFESIDLPFLDLLFRVKKLKKLQETYLHGLKNELCNGFLHPFFHLHTTTTGRSSSKSINFQNIPVRDQELGKVVRDCVVPRKGRVLAETDFSTLEFLVAACVWEDPGMLEYASDPAKDIHRDFAAVCYGCETAQVSKMMRSIAKNQFVFPVLYGSYYVSCARGLWESVDKFSLALADGTPLKKHLADKGVNSLGACDPGSRPRRGTFEHLTKAAEDHFYRSFSTFAERRERRWNDHLKKGGYRTVHGFACNGEVSRNFFQNSLVQSPAFGCLLQSLIWLCDWLRETRKKTLVVAQIHDCILKDTVVAELQEVLDATEHFMTVRLLREWSWIKVPFKVEVDVTPVDGTWAEKAPWVKKGGKWGPK